MNNNERYIVPDIMDIIYEDVVSGLYSPTQFYKRKNRIKIFKCNICCELLLKSPLTEFEISERLNFPNIDTFQSTFFDYLGVYPDEFRKRFKE